MTRKQWKRDFKAINEKRQVDSIDVYMELVKTWREAVVKPFEDKKMNYTKRKKQRI